MTGKTVLLIAAALASLASGARLDAQNPTISRMNHEELLDKFSRALDAYLKNEGEVCPALQYADEIERRNLGVEQMRFAFSIIRSTCWLDQGRYADALREAARAEAMDGRFEEPAAIDAIATFAAAYAHDWPALLLHTSHILDRDDEAEISTLDAQPFGVALAQAEPEQSAAMFLALAQNRYFDAMTSLTREAVANGALLPALEAGDRELANRLIEQMTHPYLVNRLLVSRDYALAWPLLEAHAGPGSTRLYSATLEKARRESEAAPDDAKALRALISALLATGDAAEAVRLTDGISIAPEALAELTEDQAWILEERVSALDRLGRAVEADTVYDALAGIDPDSGGRGWVVNFVINRAWRYNDLGRWAEALAAADQAVEIAEDHGSGYAKQVAKVARFCAMTKFEPGRDLSDWWSELETGWREAPGPTAMAALCRSDTASAQRLVSEGLDDPALRRDLLVGLQPAGIFSNEEPSAIPQIDSLLTGDQSLREKFERYGRILPRELWPQ